MANHHDVLLEQFLHGKRSAKEDILDEFTRLCAYAHGIAQQNGVARAKKEIATYIINTFCPTGCGSSSITLCAKDDESIPMSISEWRRQYARSRRIVLENRKHVFESRETALYVYRTYHRLLRAAELFIRTVKALLEGLFFLQ